MQSKKIHQLNRYGYLRFVVIESTAMMPAKNLSILRALVILLIFKISEQTVQLWKLKSDEIALLQFDSRPLKNYWLVTAQWNSFYCETHGHQFIYYTSNDGCMFESEPLASPWCKVAPHFVHM